MKRINDEYYVENVFATGRIDDLVNDIKIGDYVKVVLRLNKPIDDIDAERLWFRILKINDDFTILVELSNDPMYIKTLKDLDRITITRQNILETMK